MHTITHRDHNDDNKTPTVMYVLDTRSMAGSDLGLSDMSWHEPDARTAVLCNLGTCNFRVGCSVHMRSSGCHSVSTVIDKNVS